MKKAQPSPSILVVGMRDKKGKNSRHLSQLLLGGETRNERSTTFTIYLSCWEERQERKELSPSISVVGMLGRKGKKHNSHFWWLLCSIARAPKGHNFRDRSRQSLVLLFQHMNTQQVSLDLVLHVQRYVPCTWSLSKQKDALVNVLLSKHIS